MLEKTFKLQVSHHPPISAFYVECPARRISFDGYIHTKSSFLGMSIAAHMIGEGKVRLADNGEEYVVTFPSGYCRSILTTPWVELGGKCDITCPQSGYRAEVEFKCKQFWGTEQNMVVAQMYSPESKKAVLKVEGEWTNKMMAKWASGKQETFLDVTQLKPQKKVVKPVAEQERYESRRLWRAVTAGLKDNRQAFAKSVLWISFKYIAMMINALGSRRPQRRSASWSKSRERRRKKEKRPGRNGRTGERLL